MASTSNRRQSKYNFDNPKDCEDILKILEGDTETDILDLLEQDISDVEELDGNQEEVEIVEKKEKNYRIGADKLLPTDNEIGESVVDEISEISESNKIHNITDFQLKKRSDIKWSRRDFLPPETTWNPSDLPENISTEEILSPVAYFQRYIPPELFELAAQKTSMYAMQKNVQNFRVVSSVEIETLVGLHLIMSCLKYPRVEMYWDTSLHLDIFKTSMNKNRFFQLRNNLHVVDNLQKPKNCTDKLYKVRPVFDFIRKRCLELQLEEQLCIDEQMVPFRGQLNIKQYVKGKPNPWGIKIFLLCGKSGLCYDFIIYQGTTTELDKQTFDCLGLGASVVLHLTKRITAPNHKLFFDNYFSTYNLFEMLTEKNIHAAGTVRINRFANPPLLDDKTIMKKPRGTCDQVVSDDGKVVLCKWMDTRPVILASNFVGIGVIDTVCRWDKTKKKYVNVSRPEIVRLYNRSMGGVDIMDMLISYYRIFLKSKKWTLRLIFHAIDMAVTNSWLEYKIHAEKLNIPKNEILDLLHFKFRIGESLIILGKPTRLSNNITPKRGRPRASVANEESNPKRFRNYKENRPPKEFQYDLVDHMPEFDEQKEATRCKNFACKKKTHIMCEKCKVHLCFVKGRNCFKDFHNRNK